MSNTEITQGMGSTDGDAIVTGGTAGTQSGGPSGGSGMDIVTGGLGSNGEITQGYGVPQSGADTTPPTIPGISGAAVTVATITVTLTLTPGSDVDNATDTLTYNIYRDSTKIATGVAGPTWSETKAADGSSHSYGASMSDPAGNEGPVYTLSPSVVWSAPSTGGGGGSYPVYIAVQPPTVDSPLTFKQGDVNAKIVVQLLYLNGTPMDLTGKIVTVKMQPVAGGTLKIDTSATILCASLGIVSYQFVGTDTDTPGYYNLEFQATNADASPGALTYPQDSYLRVRIVSYEG